MRQLMGITSKDPLPNPDDLAFDANGIPYSRPKWKESVRKPYNKAVRISSHLTTAALDRLTDQLSYPFPIQFIDQVVTLVIDEAWIAIRAPTELEVPPCPIPEEDLVREVALKAAKTSLTNFGKRSVPCPPPR